jgi:hypothetical protein
MRIAQRNMLDYATQNLMKDSGLSEQGLRQPRDYWVKRASTPNEECWENSVSKILEDRKAFELLIDEATDEALITPSAPRNRKTVLRLALQIADHTAYHTGQLVIIRRLLCSWEK